MNNKSLGFVKQRIESGGCNDMENNNYSSMIETSFTETFRNIHHCWNEETNSIKFILNNVKFDNIKNTGSINVEIKYDQDADFEYFTMKRCCCDGTIFYVDLANSILQKLFYLGTYNISTIPSDFNKNPFKYDIKYIVGDFIFAVEYGKEFSTKEKPWMLERQTVMLPIKCEWINKE